MATAWLFVCRQLYKSGDGLLVLEGSGLHKHVAKAWKNVSVIAFLVCIEFSYKVWSSSLLFIILVIEGVINEKSITS